MNHFSRHTSHLVLLTSLLVILSCGEKHVVPMELFSTLKDGGKIHVDLEIEVKDKAHLELVRSKEEKIKQAFYFAMSERTSNFIFAKGKRELVQTINDILKNILGPVQAQGNVTNFKLVLKK